MPPVFIPFDGWSPGGGYFGEGWPIAANLYTGFGSIGHPWRRFTEMGAGVADGPMLGSYSHAWATGAGTTSYTSDAQTKYVGSKTKLYTADPSTGVFTDISRGGGYAAAGEPAGWRFATVGNDVWACNWLDVMQRRTNNAGNFANGVTSTFVPVPRFMAPIREHLVVANLNQASRFQDEIAWSDADNAVNFDPPTGTSISIAGAKRLTSIPGQITGLVGGQYGLAFKRRGIYYLEYAGGSQVFRPEVLSASVGTSHPSSIIRTRHGVFFRGSDGFYQIVGLSEPAKISPPGVDEFLLGTFGVEGRNITAWEEDTQAEAFAPAGEPRITWGYRDNAVGIGAEHVVHYNPLTQTWGYGDMSPAFLGAMMSYNGGDDLHDSTAGFSWDGTTSKYARYSSGLGGASSYQDILLELRFRSANFSEVGTQAQSLVSAVLPIFSKEFAFSSSSAQPVLNLDSALDPFQTGYVTEGPRTYAERDPIGGWYPFQRAGRFFRLRIQMAAAEFENFHGVWIDQKALT